VLVEIGAPPDKSRPPTSTIAGRVVLGGHPIGNIRVQIEGTNLSATTDFNGQFTFKNVPHGSHKLVAKGVAKNQFREGSAGVTLPAAQEPAEVVVRLE
jgi:hypothetical protein